MNTNQLKTFAQKARNMIRGGVSRQLNYWGFDENGNVECRPEKVEGGIVHREVITDDPTLMKRWEALHHAVKQHGFDQVVEEAAYTWFNRIMAICILSKNGYDLPQLEYGAGESRTPLILHRARRGQFAFLGRHEQNRLKSVLPDFTKEPQSFAILLTGYCHSHTLLNSVFGRLVDYTELLLPPDMLSENGFIHFLNTTTAITDDDYRQVELIGWLYQFYISEKKDEVFKQFKQNKKAEAKDIPAATQIFTPNWIVKFMVENTVGKIWLDQHPNSPIKNQMKYLVETPSDVVILSASEESHVTTPAKVSSLRGDGRGVFGIESLRLLDPASGSGHILVEGFELVYQMYLEEYYMPEEAVESVLKNNLFGLDIDLRAAQLARFALLIKAASKFPGILKKNILPKVFAMPAPASFSRQEILDFLGSEGRQLEEKLTNALQLMQQAQNLGSTMKFDFTADERYIMVTQLEKLKNIPIRDTFEEALLQKMAPFIEVLAVLTNRYEAIAANPPYMGSGNMNGELKQYVNQHYPLSKSDLFAVFMEICLGMNVPKGLIGMINQHSWMFLSSFEKLREEIILKYGIVTMVHLGPRTFEELSGEVVQSTVFVLENGKDINQGTYFRLVDYRNNTEKATHFLQRSNQYQNISQHNFSKIPGNPIAYWISDTAHDLFANSPSLKSVAYPRQGLATTNNDLFLRQWFEVSNSRIGFTLDKQQAAKSNFKWFPVNKGGTFRKWYGNNYFVINYENDGKTICDYIDNTPGVKVKSNGRVINRDMYFSEGLTWSTISGNSLAMRYSPVGSIFETKGGMCFCEDRNFLMPILGYLNTKIVGYLLEALSPTLDFHEGPLGKLPVVINNLSTNKNVIKAVEESINISISDWDSHEISWDFKTTPLFDALLGDIGKATSQFVKSRLQSALKDGASLQKVYDEYLVQWSSLFYRLHANEEELNRIFIDIYGLNEELDPVVQLKDVTILQEELNNKALEKTDKALRKRRQWKLVNGKWELFVDETKPLPELPVKRDVVMKQLVSYAVGCMMGRYSLQKPGLILASQGETLDDYHRIIGCGDFQIAEKGANRNSHHPFLPDDDAIIPLMGSACTFPDDAVNRFNHFLEVVWGANTLTENKNFLEECLDEEIEKYLVRDFWKDHCRTYKKKPIYWLFSSEKGAFQALVYMHRMNRFTAEKIRSKYLLKHLQYLMQEKTMLENNSALLSREELKRLENIRAQHNECERYELLLKDCADRQIEFDLDDGVSVNYELFKGVVAIIK